MELSLREKNTKAKASAGNSPSTNIAASRKPMMQAQCLLPACGRRGLFHPMPIFRRPFPSVAKLFEVTFN